MMYKSAFTDENEEKIQYKIKQFEGPLDLLLQLIDDAKIDIMDIFVSDIVDQYLDYVAHMDTTDMELACDFIEMAAKLLAIKVRALLPREEDDEFFEEDDDIDGDELIRRLSEYRLLKEKAEELKEKETLNRFFREPDFTDDDCRIVIKHFSFDKLMEAFSKMLLRMEKKDEPVQPKEVVKDRFTVAEKMQHIRDVLAVRNQVNFVELFEEDYTKGEMINTFLAVLELLKQQLASIEQKELFGDIIVMYREKEDAVIEKLDTDY